MKNTIQHIKTSRSMQIAFAILILGILIFLTSILYKSPNDYKAALIQQYGAQGNQPAPQAPPPVAF